jgi:hypothetical protein
MHPRPLFAAMPRPRHALVTFGTSVLTGCLLAACGGGSSSGGVSMHNDSSQLAFQGFAFVQHSLPGAFGAASVNYGSVPYIVSSMNDGKGNLTWADISKNGLRPIQVLPRTPYDIRGADFNGDGIPDVVSTVYSPTNVSSWDYLFFGNADGTYTQDMTFGAQYVTADGAGYRGRTEAIVVADFNNDGTVDIFLPTYTYLDSTYDLGGDPTFERTGPPPNVANALQSFLLLNDGTGKFAERAVQAGISMHATLSGLLPPSTDPNGNQPEGAQAVDFNMDGLIDLYAGGHLFINQGIDAQGVPHFKDMAPAWGLTPDLLRAAPPWAPGFSLPDTYLVTDEGAKFIDWNNDGFLDLLLFRWDWGAAHGTRLFEFDGSKFIERLQTLTTKTETCPNPPTANTGDLPPFFDSDKSTGSMTAGLNAYDLDNDGLEDVLVTGDKLGPSIYHNNGCGFTEVSGGPLDGVSGGSGSMALADLDGNGTIDVIYPTAKGVAYYENTTQMTGSSFTVEVLGPNGEHNQYGRVIQVLPPGSKQIFTRVVDSGSGYLSQNQYPILVGTPFKGAHTVKVYFAPLTPCVYGGAPCKAAVLSFSISPGQRAAAYAPSSGNPNGRAVVSNPN